MSDEAPKNYPFQEIVISAGQQLAKGNHFHQKFTCAHCGTRQTMEQPDVLFTKGLCEECGKETDIEKDGCNFMLLSTDVLGTLEQVLKNIK